jgi:two-component system alkaline phosphatase synthesis response regulator PhoP
MSSGKKILIVDDDLDLLEQHKLLLESKGYQVFSADTTEGGWELFLQEKPDAAIIDLMMEEHDSGFILSFRIKNHEYGKNIPVFILTSATYVTGYKFEAKTDEEREWIKCDEIINKPVQIDQLVQKLEHHFAEKLAHH